MHCLWKVYKAGGFHHYPPASVSQDCLCLHPISLTCTSLSFSSLLLLSSTPYLCYPLCQLSSLLISLSLCLFLSLSVLSGLVCPDWNIVCRVETSLTELKHYSFGSLVFSAELPWHTIYHKCNFEIVMWQCQILALCKLLCISLSQKKIFAQLFWKFSIVITWEREIW